MPSSINLKSSIQVHNFIYPICTEEQLIHYRNVDFYEMNRPQRL